MTYRIIDEFSHNGEGWEVRKYNPQRRTVRICGRDYFLQFPWVVFMRLWSNDKSYFSVVFAKDDDSIVYAPMLPHCSVSTDKLWIVCLGGYDWNDGDDSWLNHYCHPSNISFNDMITRFWTSSFTSFDYWHLDRFTIREAFGEVNPIHNWERSNLDQVLAVLQNPTELDEFILTTLSAISSNDVQR